jgi:hypothetical protein
MTEEEILAMKAGRELNIRVAEEVMGRRFVQDEIFGDMESSNNGTHGYLQPYSEDISAAWQVMEKLKPYCPRIGFDVYSQKWEVTFSAREANFSCPMVSANTAAEAICKAALLALPELRHD